MDTLGLVEGREQRGATESPPGVDNDDRPACSAPQTQLHQSTHTLYVAVVRPPSGSMNMRR
jgi:hypothetical protein